MSTIQDTAASGPPAWFVAERAETERLTEERIAKAEKFNARMRERLSEHGVTGIEADWIIETLNVYDNYTPQDDRNVAQTVSQVVGVCRTPEEIVARHLNIVAVWNHEIDHDRGVYRLVATPAELQEKREESARLAAELEEEGLAALVRIGRRHRGGGQAA